MTQSQKQSGLPKQDSETVANTLMSLKIRRGRRFLEEGEKREKHISQTAQTQLTITVRNAVTFILPEL